jgi:hypothetical protein
MVIKGEVEVQTPPGVASVIAPVLPRQMVDGPEIGATTAYEANESNIASSVKVKFLISYWI